MKNNLRQIRGKAQEVFPEGFYAMVSRVEDLYVLQSSRPVKVILLLTGKTAKQLLGSGGLPFPAGDIILSLDPFFPQADDGELEEFISGLMEKPYAGFIVNNLGHFALFARKEKKEKANLIAGPWLNTFNVRARDFFGKAGAGYYISPLENNRQNLERTFPEENQAARKQVFVTVFSNPALFSIRGDLHKTLGFEYFGGRKDELFRVRPAACGTGVYPVEPFSILEKTPFLRKAGFTRFILDLSSWPLKKADYRDIMEAALKAAPLPGVSRFNWKNGFYRYTIS